jgi:hypothetical protein
MEGAGNVCNRRRNLRNSLGLIGLGLLMVVAVVLLAFAVMLALDVPSQRGESGFGLALRYLVQRLRTTTPFYTKTRSSVPTAVLHQKSTSKRSSWVLGFP